MGRPSWASIEQLALVETFRQAFYAAQHNGTHTQFWDALYNEWFNIYPVNVPTLEELAEAEKSVITPPDTHPESKKRFFVSELHKSNTSKLTVE